ncbi:uncharacterized protein [Nicotiana sylvestris]|uniref:uncharacterized protein n=1 Tax=Nicotiana sylvestris TaxID=4096 RepID=UPI00388C8B4D
MAKELKKSTSPVQGVEGDRGIEGYKPPKFEMFDGTGNPRVHLRTYCEKLARVRKDEKIRMKLFMRSLTGDALSWYISQNPKKWSNWVSMASDFMDWFRFNIGNAPNVFYIQNLKKKPTETFRKYATPWRSEAAKVRPTLDEKQMNKFFIRAQNPQYYERLMVIENHKFSDIVKIEERIEEGIKSGMVTNFEALQATNKALQLGGISKKRDVGADKIQTLIDNKVIQAKEVPPHVRNNPLPDHRGDGVHVMETNEEWDPEGSIRLIQEGDDLKVAVTLTPIVVQTHAPIDVEAILWDYVAEDRQKGKAKVEESDATQGMTRTGRVYKPEHLEGSSKDATARQPIIDIRPDDLWSKVQEQEYSVVDHLNKVLAQISIMSLLQNSKAHKNALMKVLSDAYVPNNITWGKMANMVG